MSNWMDFLSQAERLTKRCRPSRVLLVLLVAMSAITMSCGGGGHSASTSAGVIVTQVGNAAEAAGSVPPGRSLFRSDALNITLQYPTELDRASDGACRPKVEAQRVSLGSNVAVQVQDNGGKSVGEVAAAFIAALPAEEARRSQAAVANTPGLSIDYRLTNSARSGSATFLLRGTKAYIILFESRDLSQCGGLAGPGLFSLVQETLRFLQ